MPFDVDEANPPDDGIVSQFPANERASRQAIADWMSFEHDEASGRHKIPRGTTAARDGFTDWKQGSLWINTDDTPNKLQMQINAGSPFSWVNVVDAAPAAFPSGTKMFFAQSTAPTGWTQDTAINDRVLRVVGGAGGGTGGSWTISGLTVDEHVLTIAEIPSHTHSHKAEDNFTAAGNDQNRATTGAGSLTTGATGGGQGHSHGLTADGAWRPSHVDVIAATKD